MAFPFDFVFRHACAPDNLISVWREVKPLTSATGQSPARGDDRQRVEETAELLLEVAELSDGEVREQLEEGPEA